MPSPESIRATQRIDPCNRGCIRDADHDPKGLPCRPEAGTVTAVQIGVPQVVVSDLDGVVRHFDPARQAAIEARHGLPRGAILTSAFEPRLLLPAITGAVSDETWRASVAVALRQRFPSLDAEGAVAEWSATSGTPDLEAVGVLRRIRQHVPVLALTNATTRLRDDLTRIGLDGAFDRIVSSAEIGHAKPSADAFHAAHEIACEVAGRACLSGGDVLFVDDSAEHVSAARRYGWSAVRYTSPHELIATCRTVGLLPEPY